MGQPKVFLSYSRQDEALREQLVTTLRGRSIDVWVDTDRIQPGMNLRDAIQDGIDKADFYILLVTPAVLQSETVFAEILYAHQMGKRIIPLLAKDSPPATKAYLDLLRYMLIDIREDIYQDGVEKLVQQLTARQSPEQQTLDLLSDIESYFQAGDLDQAQAAIKRLGQITADKSFTDDFYQKVGDQILALELPDAIREQAIDLLEKQDEDLLTPQETATLEQMRQMNRILSHLRVQALASHPANNE